MPELKNLKREQFTSEYIKQGGNAKQAYLTTYGGDNEISAESKGSRLLSIDKVRCRIIEKLQATEGCRIDDLISKLNGLSTAKKDIIIDNRVITDAVKDNNVSLEATKVLFKLYGALTPNNTQYQDNRSVTVNLNSSDVSQLKDIIASLKDMRSRDDTISGKVE